MPAANYTKWIDRVFRYAKEAGVRVLMDLHSAPGGQTGNECTGCDLGSDAIGYFLNAEATWNRNMERAVEAIDALSKICAEKGDTCYGIELLNEPYGAHIDTMYTSQLVQDIETCMALFKANQTCNGISLLYSRKQLQNVEGLIEDLKRFAGSKAPRVMNTSREALERFYRRAIKAARAHMAPTKPIVIMDWPHWLKWWSTVDFLESEYGRVQFATHVYKFPNFSSTTFWPFAEAYFRRDQHLMYEFTVKSGYDLFVSEYGLNSHGSGSDDDYFDYNALVSWFTTVFDSVGVGSMIWNYDSYWRAWGPVAQTSVGHSTIDWKSINGIGSP